MREGAGKWEMMEKWSKGERKDNCAWLWKRAGFLEKGNAGGWICLDSRKRRHRNKERVANTGEKLSKGR